MSHCDVYHGLCYISDIHQGLCQIVIFIKGYVTLWCLSRFAFQCWCARMLKFQHSCTAWRYFTMLKSILMCKNVEIPFIHYDLKTCSVTHYDLETCSVTHLVVDEISSFANHRLPMPTSNQCSNIMMYKNFFPLTPSMILFNDLIPFPTTWFQSLQGFGM